MLKLYASKKLESGVAWNTDYHTAPTEITEENQYDFFRYDHTAILFKDGKRIGKNFVHATAIIIDIDNKGIDTPERWATPASVSEQLETLGIAHTIATSRNHELQKENESSRPRFHVYFPLSEPCDLELYKKMTDFAIKTFDGDSATKDAARHFFGYGSHQNALVYQRTGKYTFDEYYTAHVVACRPTERKVTPAQTSAPPPQMDGKRPGDALNEDGIGFIKEILQKHGWTYVGHKSEHDELWRRPGKNAGHSAILHTDTPTFYVFSSNAAPFDAKTYTYFTVYATLEHGGDFSTAAKELAALGYGDALTVAPVDLSGFVTTPPTQKQEQYENENDPHAYEDDECPDKFPEHLLNVPGFMGELSQFINETSTARQPVFALAASIAFQSLLCAHNIKDPTDIRTNPYILSVGRTACGKNRGRVVIREIMKRLKEMPAIKDFYDPTHYVANRIASAEGIGTWLGVNNGILMWLWDEVGRALDTPEHKRPANINAMITAMMILYTSANDEYDPNLRADVKNTKPAIEQPNFILYGTSTKEKMFEGFSAGNLEDGLLGRLLIFEGNDDWEDIEQEDVQPVTQSLAEQAHWWFCQRANRINPVTPAPKTVDVTSEAKACFRQLADTKKQIRKEKNTIKDALWGRVVEQARQLALAYAASADHENPIVDKRAAQWACDLIVFLTKRKYHLAKRHIAGSEFDKNQKEVLRYIEEQKGKCTYSMLTRHFRKFKKWERNEILDNLHDTEAIKVTEEKVEGDRQKKVFLVINKKPAKTKK